MTNCNICNIETFPLFRAQIFFEHGVEVQYFHCKGCGFIQTEKPFWLDRAYEQSINLTDTGYVTRNIYLSKKTLLLFVFLFGKRGKYVDYAGGYGILTRLMRDYGLDFFWQDRYTPNLFARGFEFHLEDKADAVTCFESFEHFVSPLEEISKILKISKNIFFSTRLIPNKIPQPNMWEYYGLEHGQHISFYSVSTLKFIAQHFNLNLYTDGQNLHLLTESRLSQTAYKFLLRLSRFQVDLVLRKTLKSKTVLDWKMLNKAD